MTYNGNFLIEKVGFQCFYTTVEVGKRGNEAADSLALGIRAPGVVKGINGISCRGNSFNLSEIGSVTYRKTVVEDYNPLGISSVVAEKPTAKKFPFVVLKIVFFLTDSGKIRLRKIEYSPLNIVAVKNLSTLYFF